MDGYIKKEALITSIESIDWYSIHRGELTLGATSKNALYRANDIYSAIDNIPAADVAPIRHGRWKLNRHYGDYECSVCGNGDVITPFFYTLKMKYCPNCGAKMDGNWNG